MQAIDVRAVIAIGVSGQFGLRGRLPCEGSRGREYIADVERLFELTRGHVLIMGHRARLASRGRQDLSLHWRRRRADARGPQGDTSLNPDGRWRHVYRLGTVLLRKRLD